MKLYEQYPGLLYSRGKLRDSHADLVRNYAVIHLAPPKVNEAIRDAARAYYFLPVPDGRLTEKARNKFLLAADYACSFIERGQPVIVHCNAGRNRAGLVSALTLRKLLGVSGEEAMEMVRSVRPRAIANPDFEAWLKTLDRPERSGSGMKHPGDDSETLYINRFDSRCGNCGKGAVPDQVTHDVAYGYKQSEGCGVTFRYVSSDYAGMRAITELRRPDLEWRGLDE